MDESDAKATLAEIETVGGSKHEAWIKGDPAVLSERENLYQKMYPNPVESNSPPPPALANVNNSSQPAVSQPPATAGEPPTDTTPDDSQVCEDHLRQQWGEAYEANRQAAFKTRDFIFDANDPANSAIFDKVMDVAGNDSRLFSAFAHVADKLPEGPAPAVNIAEIPFQQREQMALVAASCIFPQGRLADNPILRELVQAMGEEGKQQLIDFGARLHRRLFNGK